MSWTSDREISCERCGWTFHQITVSYARRGLQFLWWTIIKPQRYTFVTVQCTWCSLVHTRPPRDYELLKDYEHRTIENYEHRTS